MKEAGVLMANVRGAVAKNKQKNVLHHVDQALKHVNISLKIR
jgi:hypothetical protein